MEPCRRSRDVGRYSHGHCLHARHLGCRKILPQLTPTAIVYSAGPKTGKRVEEFDLWETPEFDDLPRLVRYPRFALAAGQFESSVFLRAEAALRIAPNTMPKAAPTGRLCMTAPSATPKHRPKAMPAAAGFRFMDLLTPKSPTILREGPERSDATFHGGVTRILQTVRCTLRFDTWRIRKPLAAAWAGGRIKRGSAYV